MSALLLWTWIIGSLHGMKKPVHWIVVKYYTCVSHLYSALDFVSYLWGQFLRLYHVPKHVLKYGSTSVKSTATFPSCKFVLSLFLFQVHSHPFCNFWNLFCGQDVVQELENFAIQCCWLLFVDLRQ